MKDILITGADVFIGSHLTETLVHEGFNVKALSHYNSFNHWGWLEDIDCLSDIEVLTGDVRDPHYCRRITKNIDTIFHLAALIAIPYSYVAPDSYLDTNIKGTLNICQAALENGCEKVIQTSTSEVYGTAQYVPIDEAHPLQPQSPYSASKIGADMIAMSFHHAYALPVIVARPFNTFGPRQSTRAIIPTMITQLAKGKDIIALGDMRPTRDFTYVMDTCSGFLSLSRCERAVGQVVNIGSNYEISMEDLFHLIKQIMQSKATFQSSTERLRPETSEVFRLWCDNAKLIKMTGFTPSHTIRAGLEKTIAWYTKAENLTKFKADIYNV